MVSYYERLDNLFAAYAPAKRPHVVDLLQKYAGREEAILKSLVKKYGPEPVVSVSDESPKDVRDDGNNYRARLIRFYTKYAPKKISSVDKTLARFAGREEELFFALVKTHGPEPPVCTGGGAKTPEDCSDSRSTMSSSTASCAWAPYNVHDARWRLARIYMAYAPEKLAIVDQMMDKYAGREEEMLASCVTRYGLEPLSPDTQSPRRRLLRFIELYVPRKTASVEPMLQKYGGRMEELFGMLVQKLGPEPPAPLPSSGPPKMTYRQRLIRFYKVYAREKVANMETVLHRYKGNEEEMFRILVEKYGPEPDPDVDPDAPIPPERNYRARLTRLFATHAPERMDTIPALLTKYKGREDDIIKAFAKKLGPEPPLDSPISSNVMTADEKQLARSRTSVVLAARDTNSENKIIGKPADGEERETHQAANAWDEFLQCFPLPVSVYRRYAVDRLGEERVSALESRFCIPRLHSNGTDEPQWVVTMSSSPGAEHVALGEATPWCEETAVAQNISANFSCLLLMLETVDFPLPPTYLEGDVFRRYPLCTLIGDRDRSTLQTCAAIMDLQAKFEGSTQCILIEEDVARQRIVTSTEEWKQQHCAKLEDKKLYLCRLLEKAVELLPELENKERKEIEAVECIEFKGMALWFIEGLQTRHGFRTDPRDRKQEPMLRCWKGLTMSNSNSSSPSSWTGRTTGSAKVPELWRSQDQVEQHIRRQLKLTGDSGEDLLASSREMRQILDTAVEAATPVAASTSYASQRQYHCGDGDGDGGAATRSWTSFSDASPSPRNPCTFNESTRRVLHLGGTTTASVSATQACVGVDVTGRDKWGPANEGRLSEVTPSPCHDAREAVMLGETLPAGSEQQKQKPSDYVFQGTFRCTPFFFQGERHFPSTF
ncbi:hypothetical protein DQ04_01641080 [Trypanosoma grayi]|uniref:hypothetical protein n=1 Tax=Trypanosoma grayi TaxID=71804 RepID=UPI0004F3F999|nr:hypothetical protein DQ04_01641080 [Trypanosoma grayi]KEG12529.1 hypothetical protein DQ04_01641080 [Trypanosoma grayi]